MCLLLCKEEGSSLVFTVGGGALLDRPCMFFYSVFEITERRDIGLY